MATAVEWNDRYSVELPEIDDQHKALFGMINDLWRAIIDRKSDEAVGAILTRLEDYTIMHFSAEEALMRMLSYPNLDSHRKTHEKFIQQIAIAKHRHLEGRVIGLEVLHFLNNWLIDHIMTLDKGYAAYIERKRKPRSWLTRLFSVD
jgi:hemerythrin-like metal-binding protein